jgi:outer membrane murein-binding lipoprotein Lpp
MTADLRGFEYAAEPVLRRRQWELDAAVAALGRETERLAQAKAHERTLRAQLAARLAEPGDGARFDPAGRVRMLAWLAALHGRIDDARRIAAQVQAQRDEASAHLRTLQAQVDAIEAHREDAARDFAQAASNRAAAEADREWLARRAALAHGTKDER